MAARGGTGFDAVPAAQVEVGESREAGREDSETVGSHVLKVPGGPAQVHGDGAREAACDPAQLLGGQATARPQADGRAGHRLLAALAGLAEARQAPPAPRPYHLSDRDQHLQRLGKGLLEWWRISGSNAEALHCSVRTETGIAGKPFPLV